METLRLTAIDESPLTAKADPQPAGLPLTAAQLQAVTGDRIAATVAADPDEDDQLTFYLAAAAPVPLRRMSTALQSLDLEVLHEQTGTWAGANGAVVQVHMLRLQAGPDAAARVAGRDALIEQHILATFEAIWSGHAEADGFNALVLSAGLNWRQVTVLRSYSRYLRQLPLPYGQTRIQRILLDHPEATRALLALFDARFSGTTPAADETRHRDRIAPAHAQVTAALNAVVHIDADRILRAYANLISATVRTNAFTAEALTPAAPYLVHKLSAQDITELPQPRPLSEIFVYAPQFEGVHMRFGLVARGGLRWSDRHDDYRTEVLGLVKAQAVKNAVIVPVGAKGVFVVKPTPSTQHSRLDDAGALRTHAQHCYQQFIAALLDVVDNASPGTQPTPNGIINHDGPDPYLVVAADKGTATFSDAANAVAVSRSYWLGDAFASGGSSGYDHKAMGITARGAWVSGDFHLRDIGIDPHSDTFTAAGIGDMSGDVFGNGMLLRPTQALIAAFDHRDIFIDPQPSLAAAYQERSRLFALPRSSWQDYDQTLISAGGGVWSRTSKTIPISPQIRDALALPADTTTIAPSDLIRCILTAPVDVLFNGGVGTYVKASDEPHAEVADKINDTVRVDAAAVRARVIIEGGNLGVSARGRIEFARRGGHINTDAVDNAAGVDCSDHEVNIKILVDSLPDAQSRAPEERDALLAAMTDDVAAHVLANNRDHNRLLSDAQFNAPQTVLVHARMTRDLERRRELHRRREHLPSEQEYAELAKAATGLTRPQLATLMAHVKLDLKSALLRDDTPDDDYFGALLDQYFPPTLRLRARASVTTHPLRREIIATSIANRVLATSGLTYAYRLSDETGASPGDVVRAHAVVSEVFDLDTLWADIYGASLPPQETNALIIEGRRLLDRASRWFLLNRPQPLNIGDEITRFAEPIAALRGQIATMLRGNEQETVSQARAAYLDHGTPPSVATSLAESLYAFSLLDIVEMALGYAEDASRLAKIYFELSAHLGVDTLLLGVSSLARGERWTALARLALREDLYRSLRELALDVARRVHFSADTDDVIEQFHAYNGSQIQRARRTLDEFLQVETPDLAVLSVASAQLRRLTTAAVQLR